jgi:putative hydrolase of the HAD superfamily
MLKEIKIVGFDADDTLWINEPLYQETEKQFCKILTPYSAEEETTKELFKTEMQNLEMYGYGAKGFLLSMIETALRVSEKKITAGEIILILELGKKLLNEPIILLDNVELVLQKLKPKYKLILATKGDLLDQERKLRISGLSDYFHHIEIMSDKHENNYSKLIRRLDIKPQEFLMIGNSVKSDILPVINAGAKAIHIPFEVTWQHEKHHEEPGKDRFITVNNLMEVLDLL